MSRGQFLFEGGTGAGRGVLKGWGRARVQFREEQKQLPMAFSVKDPAPLPSARVWPVHSSARLCLRLLRGQTCRHKPSSLFLKNKV